jgi:hypothetical protein
MFYINGADQISAAMSSSVTTRTERNEIGFGIAATLASELLMVDFEVRNRTARLAAPLIPAEYPLPLGLV